jgi:hypothetical protein
MSTCSQHGEIQSPARQYELSSSRETNSGRPLKRLLDTDIEIGSGQLIYVPEYDN